MSIFMTTLIIRITKVEITINYLRLQLEKEIPKLYLRIMLDHIIPSIVKKEECIALIIPEKLSFSGLVKTEFPFQVEAKMGDRGPWETKVMIYHG